VSNYRWATFKARISLIWLSLGEHLLLGELLGI